ncbi:Crp/Fnr family transcriptional regulator [Sphingomonas sp. RB3P16]|uniref:Crp/Fnr family transcriptional regulator n=1 Tax=Parasphingomonas frigoris TaxID=3096163 RepID=UPI002FC7957C
MAVEPLWSRNRFLDSLSSSAFDFIKFYLRPVDLVQGDVLVEGGEKISSVYFPHSSVISLAVRLENGATVEAAMIGNDGIFGAFSALDGKLSLNTAIVRIGGGASILDTTQLRATAQHSELFRALLMRYEQVIFGQAVQSAACNASHSVEARLSRWLLRARDLSARSTLPLTQEFLADMLGTRRNSVSVVANRLQQAGLIRYRRGQIEITDVPGLRARACECYGVVKSNYEKLLRGPITDVMNPDRGIELA